MPEDIEADEVMEEAPVKAKAKKGKSKLLIIGIPVVLIQILVAYFLVNWLFLSSMPEKETKANTEIRPKKKKPFGVPFEIQDITINIPTEERRSRYFVTDVGFECENEATAGEMSSREFQIKDIIIGTIMSKKLEQLLSNEFIEETLKVELRDNVNDVLVKGSVESVYLSERIIQ